MSFVFFFELKRYVFYCIVCLFVSTEISMGPQMTYNEMFVPSTTNILLWRCKACGKEVTNRWHHYHSHTPQRSFCPYCPATYSRIDTLRSHMRSKHSLFLKHAGLFNCSWSFMHYWDDLLGRISYIYKQLRCFGQRQDF